jgi:hypothetical protein
VSATVVAVPQVRDFMLTLIDDAIARRELGAADCEDCQGTDDRCRAHAGDPAKVRTYMDLYEQVRVAESGAQLESAIIAAAQIEADRAEAPRVAGAEG